MTLIASLFKLKVGPSATFFAFLEYKEPLKYYGKLVSHNIVYDLLLLKSE